MPGMDGFETAQHIKRRERTRHVPIIFLTAADREAQLALRGYAAGGVDYITKPFDPWMLRVKVSIFIELWSKTQQLIDYGASGREGNEQIRVALDELDRAGELLQVGQRDGQLGEPELERLRGLVSKARDRLVSSLSEPAS
jgi:DNA-binding response OmpR family regulator